MPERRIAAKGTLRIVLAIAACAVVSHSAVAGPTEPTLNRALSVSAADLAQGYLWVSFVSKYLIAVANKGVKIHLGNETIDKNNVEEYQRKYDARLQTYRKAIEQRGYKTIAGEFRGNATEACARAGSAWVRLIRAGRASSIEVTQKGFNAQLVVTAKQNGTKVALSNVAAIVESSIVVQDRMNSEYFFRGTITDKEIRIKPILSVLRSWPKWAHPPRKEDLENCTVTLKPLSRQSGTEK